MTKPVKYTLIALAMLVFYALTVVPVGLAVYTWKSQKGVDIFSTTGFHSVLSCVRRETHKAVIEKERKLLQSRKAAEAPQTLPSP